MNESWMNGARRPCLGHTDSSRAERRTSIVTLLTVLMMAGEIAVGLTSGSMALLADGLHMASHTLAFCITLFAYSYARRHASNPRFSFGTGKVNALGGYSGALTLGIFALWMAWESIERAFNPVDIRYREAISVAVIGLIVNAGSALLLKDEANGTHGARCLHQHDHNLRSAYLHVLADAATSAAAIVALLAAEFLNAPWIDPLVGIAGAALVASWSIGQLRASANVLLDHEGPASITDSIREAIEQMGDEITDWHCWAIAPGRYAAIVSIRTQRTRSAEQIKAVLPRHKALVHLTVEVNDPI